MKAIWPLNKRGRDGVTAARQAKDRQHQQPLGGRGSPEPPGGTALPSHDSAPLASRLKVTSCCFKLPRL